MADAANHLVATKLGGLSADQQQQLINQLTRESTPKGVYSPNFGYKFVTATKGSDGRWTAAISADAFTKRKEFFRQASPGMVSGGSNFYPAEAQMIIYSIAAGDLGYGNAFVATAKKQIGNLTGLDMTSRMLFGSNGYLARRPLDSLFDQPGTD